MDDTDLFGPIIFCILFATFLLLVCFLIICTVVLMTTRAARAISDMCTDSFSWEQFHYTVS
jgi:hypothetical protein